MQKKPHSRFVRIAIERVDASRIERRGAALHAVNDVALVEQELRQIRAVLSGHAGDEGDGV